MIAVERAVQLVGLAIAATLSAVAASRPRAPARPHRARHAVPFDRRLHWSPDDTARGAYWASALLALAALADSGIEHYRGSFHNKAMYVPLGVSALTLAASLRDAAGQRDPRRRADHAIADIALATGAAGTGFHLYNIAKRPGGFSWLNLFYAAPLGAPAALSLAGLLRRMAAGLSRGGRKIRRLGRLLAGLVSVGLIGTSAEAGLLHFRGAYHNPAMVIPVVVPPMAAAMLSRAALGAPRHHPITRQSLRLLAAMGIIGSAFHVYGVHRNMGGWRNWSQNLLNGPPIPAPPAFTALALAGLAALGCIEETKR